MNIETAFPSAYMKCADLNGRELQLTIDTVTVEDLGDDRKPVLHFSDHEKSIALNKTNALEISNHYSAETDYWRGKPLVIYPAKTMFQGRQVDCIRVRVPQNGAPSHAAPPQPPLTPDPPLATVTQQDADYGCKVIDLASANNLCENTEKWIAWIKGQVGQPTNDFRKHIGKFEQSLKTAGIALPGQHSASTGDDDLPF